MSAADEHRARAVVAAARARNPFHATPRTVTTMTIMSTMHCHGGQHREHWSADR